MRALGISFGPDREGVNGRMPAKALPAGCRRASWLVCGHSGSSSEQSSAEYSDCGTGPSFLGSRITHSTRPIGTWFPPLGGFDPGLPQPRSNKALAAVTRAPAGASASFMISASTAMASSLCSRARSLMSASVSVSSFIMERRWRAGANGSIGLRGGVQITRRLDVCRHQVGAKKEGGFPLSRE